MKFNRKSSLAMICGFMTLMMLMASCSGGNTSSSSKASSGNGTSSVSDESASDESGTDSSGETSSEQGAQSGGNSNAGGTANITKSSSKSSSVTAPVTGKTINVKDFGAKGDGVTDDGDAIVNAVSKMYELGDGATLVFESNKTYYAKNNSLGQKYIFTVNGGKNMTIKGNNTTLLIDGARSYANIAASTGFTLQGFNFDYKTKPAFRAVAVSGGVNSGNSTAVMIADRDIGLENGEEYIPSISWFGVLDKPKGRYHMYIKKYKMIDKASRKFEVTFNSGDANTKRWVADLTSVALTAPMPNVGHMIERAFTFDGNTNFTMKDCNIYAVSRFGIALFRSEGTVKFTNVNYMRAPNNLDKNLNFVSWRDGYHVKENRAKVIWENCKAEALYDDVINISASTLHVKEINSAKDEVNLYWGETGGTYSPLKTGDTLTIINTKTGMLIGTASVKRVMSQSGSTNRVKLDKALPNLTTGEEIYAFFDSMAAPGSEIKNCNFDGTFRFRGELTVTNSRFYNRRMWIDLFRELEGPIPQNILFKNTTFETDSATEVYFHITSGNSNTGSGSYHLKNIVFDGCKINRSNVEVGPGDDVRFLNSK